MNVAEVKARLPHPKEALIFEESLIDKGFPDSGEKASPEPRGDPAPATDLRPWFQFLGLAIRGSGSKPRGCRLGGTN